jgi:hypothetical protein
MSGELRADLTGADKAVSEVLDEVNIRMHGLISGGSYHREFLDWLGERGYVVVRKGGTGPCGCCEIDWRLCRGLYDKGLARCCSDCTHDLEAKP